MELMIPALGKVASTPPNVSWSQSSKPKALQLGSESQLNVPEWFRIARLPGQVFHLTRVMPTYVEAYGGDKTLCGRRQFRSFPLDTEFISVSPPEFSKKSTGLRGCIE